jgi:hypothetical protein
MAFLVYFFVLLVMASSIMFGLDWVRAPLHSPSAQRTQVATSGTPRKSEPQQKPRAPLAAVPIGRTQTASSVAPEQPEPVVAEKPTVAPEQKQVVAEQPPAPVKETTGAATPAGVQNAQAKPDAVATPATQESATAKTAAPAKQQTRSARRKSERERIARAPAWAVRGAEAAQREAEGRYERVPRWAMQGAESARREAEEMHARPMYRPFWVSRDEPWRW